MSSSLPDPGHPPRPEWLVSAKAPTPRSSGEPPGLIEEILQETSKALISQEPLTAAERRAFEDVAVRFRGQSLPLETIVSDLVFAVLRNHISALPGFEELGRSLSERVARTLIDDPTAKLRLESLWNRLQGEPA
ncbi:MAG: hypothetical protein ABSG53_15555 [Thermoguttaceae bacterium]|jgi:hypothetical protein